MFRVLGIFAIIPMSVLLTVSFFVLFANRKTESGGLKAFGYVVAALLWVSAAIIFSTGIYTIATGKHPMISMMRHMKGPMMGEKMPRPPMGEQMPEPMKNYNR